MFHCRKIGRNLTLLSVNPFVRIGRVSSITHDGYADALKKNFLGSRHEVNLAKLPSFGDRGVLNIRIKLRSMHSITEHHLLEVELH